MSILWENSSTAFFSSSVSSLSSISTGSIFFSSSLGTSGASGVRVRDGTSTAAAAAVSSGVNVSSGIIFSLIVLIPFRYILSKYCKICGFPAHSCSVMPPSASPLPLRISSSGSGSLTGFSCAALCSASPPVSPSRAIMLSSTVMSVEMSMA